MISLVFRDADKKEIAFFNEVYDLRTASVAQGGPLSLIATVPIDVLGSKIDLLHDVRFYDGFDEPWIGRVKERPRVSKNRQAATIICQGYSDHMKDTRFKRHYIDTGYANWSTVTPVGYSADRVWEHGNRDNNNRVFIQMPANVFSPAGMITGLYYRPANIDQINQTLLSITFDWETGAGYLTAENELRLASFVSDITLGTATVEWTQGVDGAQSGSETITITGSKKALQFYFFGISTDTPADETNWGIITNIRVNGLTGFEVGDTPKPDDFIKNFISVSESLSTDVSQIDAGTFTITDLVFENPTTPFEALTEVNKYERYNWGVSDRDSSNDPRLTYEPHDKGTVHYYASLQNSQMNIVGESIENQYNEVDVIYQDAVSGRNITENRTATHTLLDALGITRKAKISVQTTSLVAAQQAGDAFLADKAQKQGKGSMKIQGDVIDEGGRTVPAYTIKPGTNILVYDLEIKPGNVDTLAGADVLNGENCFRIVRVDADVKKREATLQLDNEGDRLDLLMARR